MRQQIREIIALFDKTGKGSLDYSEFVQGLMDEDFSSRAKGPAVFIFGR